MYFLFGIVLCLVLKLFYEWILINFNVPLLPEITKSYIAVPLMIILRLLDWHSTKLGLGRGIKEANPVVRFFILKGLKWDIIFNLFGTLIMVSLVILGSPSVVLTTLTFFILVVASNYQLYLSKVQ